MDWRPIEDFPGYSVSSMGQIQNDRTGRILALTRNQHGVVQVGLMRRGLQYKRGVALLVASAFLDPPVPDTFDSVINLDGDRCNNEVDNLMWRPRWFAVMYHKQFDGRIRGIRQPIQDTKTGYMFRNSWEAATTYGLLDKEILMAITNRTYVWPTYQEFKVVRQHV